MTDEDSLGVLVDHPVLAGRIPVADVTACQVECDTPPLSRLNMHIIEAAEHGRGIVATELDVLICVGH